MTSPRNVLIAGAGIGGLAAALVLREQGWQVSIFERAGSQAELGFDLMLAANALDALRELGLSSVEEQAVTVNSVAVATPGRRRMFDLSPVRESLRPKILSREALHGALLAQVGSAAITFGAEVSGCESKPGLAVLALRDGRTIEGDMIVGADGVKSAIRTCLHPNTMLRPGEMVGVRGVAYGVDSLLDADLIMAMCPGADSGVIRGASGAVYWFVSARADVAAFRQRSAEEVAELLVAPFGEPLATIARLTRNEHLRAETLTDCEPLRAWGHGAITLLGDAAHPMLPHAGQGAAQALEDAVALGIALHGTPDYVAGLRRYENVRAIRTARVVRLARRLSRVRTARNRAVNAMRDAAIQILPVAALHLSKLSRPTDPHARLRQ
jgi:2-polyprenyl-6-methoxyphenol hydroxylase-like FAD-dependent oxidoreductase